MRTIPMPNGILISFYIMLKGIIRLIPLDFVIPSGNLQLYEGDISLPSDVEGIPFGNYGNDDWNQF